MSIYAIGVFLTFVLYIVVGNYAGRAVKDVDDYYVSGRNAPTVLIVGTLVASYLSTVAFMGETGFSYEGYVIPLLILIMITFLGYFGGAYYFGRFIRRAKALTIPEYFGRRFDSSTLQMVSGIINVVGIGAYLVAVTQGSAILMSELLGTSYGLSLLIVWAVYTSFCFYSGSKGVILTDTIMFFFFVLMSFIAIPFIYKAAGGWPQAIMKTAVLAEKPDILSWHGLTGVNNYMGTPTDVLVWAIVLGLVWAAVLAVSPWQTSRYLMAKNEHTVIRSAIMGTIAIGFIYCFLHISMTTLNLVNPNISPSETAFIWSAFNIFPTWLGIVVLGGIMASALSSCSTFLSLVGFSVSNDIIPHLSKNHNNKELLRMSRMVMLIVGLVTLVITYFQPPAVMWIGYFAATLFAATYGVVSFMSIWSKKITAKGALWGIIAGFVVVAVTEGLKSFGGVSYPVYFRPPILGAVASYIGVLIGSKLSQPTEAEKKYRENLFIVPEEEKSPVEIKRTRLYPKLLMISGIIFVIGMYFLYYHPYSIAVLK